MKTDYNVLKALGAKAPDPDPDENKPEWESEAGE